MDTPLLSELPTTGASKSEAFYNMLNFTVGAGMLGLPHALLFSKSFYVVPVLLGGVLCYYTASLLHKVQLLHGVNSYQALGGACGGKLLRIVVVATLSVNQFGIAVLYVITACNNCEMLLGGDEDAPRWWLYPLLALVTVAVSTRGESLAHVSGMSSLGLISVVAVGLLVVGAAARVSMSGEAGMAGGGSAVSVRDALAGLGTAIFAYGGHPVYPDVQGSMVKQVGFGSVLLWAFALMIGLFVLVTGSSWRAFGCSVHGYVLDDLQQSAWRTAAVVGMTLHLVAAVPIVLLPMMRVIEGHARVGFRYVRLGVVVVTVLVAYLFPFFTDFLNLLGGLTENLLVFFLPISFYHLSNRKGRGSIRRVLFHIGLLALASSVLVLGTLASLEGIATKYRLQRSSP